ncbi:CPBP family intramembrane glutamic endopeptidase [Natronococcus jeotgali]|uniref:CPBP family intramembrane glutamic endopeptidase n=1 Tax=Natronococcus jeotgali TaxID=413812 RepID=UPI0012688267
MFRGVVQGRLRESFGPLASVIVASLLFGLMHLFNYSGSVPEMVAGSAVIVCVSLVFGALYEVSGSLLISSVVHGLYNAILMVSAYLTL